MMTALMWAAFHGKPNHIKVLLEKGADPAISDMDGMMAVHWSVQRHDTRALQVEQCMAIICDQNGFCQSLCQVLINQDSAQYSTKKGKTVMHQAAEQVTGTLRLSTKTSII